MIQEGYMPNDKKNHTKKNSKHIRKAKEHREDKKQGGANGGETAK